MKQFLVDDHGKCSSCAQSPPDSDSLRCCSCDCYFHAVCSTVDKSDYLCTPSYLKTFRASKKDNFKWFCDSCLTNFEVSKTAQVDDRIGHLVNQVSKMAANMTQLNETVSTLQEAQANASVAPGKESNVSVWNDSKRTQVVKASLLIKPSEGTKTPLTDFSKIKDIAVNNNIQVRNVGVSQNGNTFIHCSSSADRDKLQPLLTENYQDKEIVPLKEKLPYITIVDIAKVGTSEVKNADVLLQVRNQNPIIAELIDSGEEFQVLFVKSHSSSTKYSAVVKVSRKIRDIIKRNGHRLFVGITSCRVYDRFFIKRCNKCQEFGHYKDKCTNDEVCGYCGENHPSSECRLKETSDLSKLKCNNCKKNNLDCTGHSTFWTKCPAYVIAQKRLKATIPYYEKNAPSGNRALNG